MTARISAKDYARIAKRRRLPTAEEVRGMLGKPARKAKRRNPEAQLQRAVAAYLTLALPHDAYWSAVGHGGGGKIRGAQLLLMGVKPGVPDIFILHQGRFLGIELKSADGKLSEAQQRAAHKIEQAGGLYYVCRSLADVMDALARAGILLTTRENLRLFHEHWIDPKRKRSA